MPRHTFSLAYSITVIAQEKDRILMVTEEFIESWNETLFYGYVFKREHSISLAEAIRNILRGKALDVAMGEGRNTLFLARNGWETTGFDIVDVALDSVRARASRENLDEVIITSSYETFDFGSEKWDPIAVKIHQQFYHCAQKYEKAIKTAFILNRYCPMRKQHNA